MPTFIEDATLVELIGTSLVDWVVPPDHVGIDGQPAILGAS